MAVKVWQERARSAMAGGKFVRDTRTVLFSVRNRRAVGVIAGIILLAAGGAFLCRPTGEFSGPTPGMMWSDIPRTRMYLNRPVQFTPDGKSVLIWYGGISHFDAKTGVKTSDGTGQRSLGLSTDGYFEVKFDPGQQVGKFLPNTLPPSTPQPPPRWAYRKLFKNRALLITDVRTGKVAHRIPLPDSSKVYSPLYAELVLASGTTVAVNDSMARGVDGRRPIDNLLIFDIATGRLLHQEWWYGKGDSLKLTASPEGRIFFQHWRQEDADARLKLLDETGKPWKQFATPMGTGPFHSKPKASFSPVAFSRREQRVAAVRYPKYDDFSSEMFFWYGQLYVWDTATGKELWSKQFQNEHSNAVVFSPDGKYLAYGGGIVDDPDYMDTGIVRVLEADTGREVTHFYATEAVPRLSRTMLHLKRAWSQWHPPSTAPNVIVSVPLGQRVGDSGEVKYLAWSPDSKQICVSYAKGDVRMWRMPEKL